MKLSISDTRRRLPELVRQLQKSGRGTIEITVRGQVVAELRGKVEGPARDDGAAQLLKLMDKMPKFRRKKINVSGQIYKYLYGNLRSQR